MAAEQTVFVVDDDEASRDSVKALVEPMGVRIELFSSAEDFLRAYSPTRPGCLVTDLRMLGMSGIDLLEKLNALHYRIPTVVMSAYADVPAAVRAMQEGAITLLEKPCRGMELWNAVRKALNQDQEDRRNDAARVAARASIDRLTDQERDIMSRIVDGAPNKTIANSLDIGLRTVEARRRSIFKKTGTSCVAELVRLVGAAGDMEPN